MQSSILDDSGCARKAILLWKKKASCDRKRAFGDWRNLTTAVLEKGPEVVSITTGGKYSILGFLFKAVAHSSGFDRIRPTEQTNSQACQDCLSAQVRPGRRTRSIKVPLAAIEAVRQTRRSRSSRCQRGEFGRIDVGIIADFVPQFPEAATPNSSAHIMPSNQSGSKAQSKSKNTLSDSTSETKTSKAKGSPYDRNCEQNLIDNGIYPPNYHFPDGRATPKPNNENEILARLGQPRPSLSPSQFSEKAFRSFQQKNARALNDDAVMIDVFPVIQGNAQIPSAKNIVFGNLDRLTPGNLVDAKPDFYDGACPTQIHRQIRKELGSYITPSPQQQAPALPNFFTEVRGPDGSAAVAITQACYDGALGARAIHKLQSLRQEPICDNNAYTITSIYYDGTLKIYTIHSTQATDLEDSHEYYMTQLGAFSTTDTNPETFRRGAGAFRNARDWAKEQRDRLIAAANSRVTDMPKEESTLESSSCSMSQSTTEPVVLESEKSADELSQDMGRYSRPSNKRLKREPEKCSSNLRPEKSHPENNRSSRSTDRRSHMG